MNKQSTLLWHFGPLTLYSVWKSFATVAFLLLFSVRVGGEELPTISKDLLGELQAMIHPLPHEKNVIGYLEISGEQGIDEGTWIYIKSALDAFKRSRPLFILLKLNTPGGQVFSAQKIADALKELDTRYGIPVVAYIDNWAISAGAMIAYSCRFIATAKDGSMGAAEPVILSASNEMQAASEKVNSALRTDFANRAAYFNRNGDLAEAMVDKDLILVERNGRILRLSSEDEIQKGGDRPDLVISAKGKLLTLKAAEMVRWGVADFIVPPLHVPPPTPQEVEAGSWPAVKEPLFQLPFFREIPDSVISPYTMDWKLSFLAFLARPMVTSALFMVMVLGFYLEFNTPGFGVAGSVALTALGLLILSSFALELASFLELILIAVGLLLVLVELFVTPTFGLLGVVGALLLLGGTMLLSLPSLTTVTIDSDSWTLNPAGDLFVERLAGLLVAFLVGIVLSAILGRFLSTRLGKLSHLALVGHEQDSRAGYRATGSLSLPSRGEGGVAATALRPGGKVLVGGHLFDAVSMEGFLDSQTAVVVCGVDGSTLLVAEQRAEPLESNSPSREEKKTNG